MKRIETGFRSDRPSGAPCSPQLGAPPGSPLPACGEGARVRGSHTRDVSTRDSRFSATFRKEPLIGWSPWLPLTPTLSPSPSGPLWRGCARGWPEGGGERESYGLALLSRHHFADCRLGQAKRRPNADKHDMCWVIAPLDPTYAALQDPIQ